MTPGPADANASSAAQVRARSGFRIALRRPSWLIAVALILSAMGGSLWLLGSRSGNAQRIAQRLPEAEPELQSPLSPAASRTEVTQPSASPESLPEQFAALAQVSRESPVKWSRGSATLTELSDEPDLIHVVSAPEGPDGSAQGAWLTGEIEPIADPPALSSAAAVEDLSGKR